ncbi:MAG: class I SAM-dependent methyltransferase [Acidobacteriota bacterium]|nr:class I SAM-dependent methyltransferase [Acidobacteriota bacterium]
MESFSNVPLVQVKDYWDRRPCNIRHSRKTVGTKEYFDEVTTRKYFVEPHIPPFADFARWNNKRVLEIGCGIGTDTLSFAQHGAHVTAVDLSEKSLEIAQQRAQVYGQQDRIEFYRGNSEELSQFVPVKTYDLVYSFGVIHHTPNPEKVLEQLCKYMDSQSELRLMVYSKASYKLFQIMKDEGIWDMSRLDELIARNSEAQTGCPVTYTYTHDEARALLQGYEILEMRKAHIFTWDVEAYKQYEYKKDQAWAQVTDSQLQSLEKELGWHLLIRARLAQ